MNHHGRMASIQGKWWKIKNHDSNCNNNNNNIYGDGIEWNGMDGWIDGNLAWSTIPKTNDEIHWNIGSSSSCLKYFSIYLHVCVSMAVKQFSNKWIIEWFQHYWCFEPEKKPTKKPTNQWTNELVPSFLYIIYDVIDAHTHTHTTTLEDLMIDW